jgi:hypothetical protein
MSTRATLHVEARADHWQVTEVIPNSDLPARSWAVVVEPVRGKPTRRVRIRNQYGNLLDPKTVYAARALAAVRAFNSK